MRWHKYIVLVVLLCSLSTTVIAGKPRWIGNTPHELNNTYRFVEVVSHGSNIAAARLDAQLQLAQNEQLRRAVTVNVESGSLRNIGQKIVNGNMSETISDQVVIDMKVRGKEYRLQACIVDEYVEHEAGMTILYSLYQVGITNRVTFDRTYKSTSYGATPAIMSIVPGLGQIYKGSTMKGIVLFAGVAACAGASLYCENMRSDYKNKMKEQPDFAKDYNTKANNWETARNICIGATAAVWIFNIIDAAAAKGSRRIIVKKNNYRELSLKPMVSFDGAGMAMTYNF